MRWRDAAEKGKWSEVLEKIPDGAKEIPNFIKLEQFNDGTFLKGRKPKCPPDVEVLVEEALGMARCGSSALNRRAGKITSDAVQKAAQKSIASYNAYATGVNKVVSAKNIALAEELEIGSISPEDALSMKADLLPLAEDGNLIFSRWWATRFLKQWGWKNKMVNTDGVYYDINHPIMNDTFRTYEDFVMKNDIDKDLILVYDQVWKIPMTAFKKAWTKNSADIGVKGKPRGVKGTQKKVLDVKKTVLKQKSTRKRRSEPVDRKKLKARLLQNHIV